MLLIPIVYRQIYNQGFVIGWHKAFNEAQVQAHLDAQAWLQRKAAAQQAELPFSEPLQKNIHMTQPDYQPPPIPWQDPELPAWLFWTTAAAIALLTAAAALLILGS